MKPKDKNKEEKIIQCTLDIVSETGIAGLKMSVLAKRAGISPSTLYVYFETKEDLIASIGIMLVSQINKNGEKIVKAEKPFEVRFKAKWIGMINFLLNNHREVNFIEQWKQSPYFNQKSKEAWQANKKSKDDLFQEGRDLGVLKNLNEHMTYAIMFGFASQLVTQINLGNLKLDQTVINESYAVVWDAISS